MANAKELRSAVKSAEQAIVLIWPEFPNKPRRLVEVSSAIDTWQKAVMLYNVHVGIFPVSRGSRTIEDLRQVLLDTPRPFNSFPLPVRSEQVGATT